MSAAERHQNTWVKALSAKRHSVEAETMQRGCPNRVEVLGVGFETDFGVNGYAVFQSECIQNETQQGRIDMTRGPASKVDRLERAPGF
jgi:hypothetical protein